MTTSFILNPTGISYDPTDLFKPTGVTVAVDRLQQHYHDDVMEWKYCPCYWPFVWGIHRSPMNSPHKGQWRGVDVFFDLRLNKRMSKQSWSWWFETQSHQWWLGDLVAILKVQSMNTCYELISKVLFVKLFSGESHKTSLMVNQH